jgi:hypothetical protein
MRSRPRSRNASWSSWKNSNSWSAGRSTEVLRGCRAAAAGSSAASVDSPALRCSDFVARRRRWSSSLASTARACRLCSLLAAISSSVSGGGSSFFATTGTGAAAAPLSLPLAPLEAFWGTAAAAAAASASSASLASSAACFSSGVRSLIVCGASSRS